ncbi:hypothetical protein DPMN_088240 [Dreissena polymorpha]|uniref:Uncharacterized protein n=1 Tax=Dreissena polymorpha TaxID=45954 RepID=A0A9D4KTR2_DREPO|nr:hypothetical protein DPMN_088240 [Dreissena polymorpha]
MWSLEDYYRRSHEWSVVLLKFLKGAFRNRDPEVVPPNQAENKPPRKHITFLAGVHHQDGLHLEPDRTHGPCQRSMGSVFGDRNPGSTIICK